MCPHPRTQRKNPLTVRGRVKMTLRMQEKWTSATEFFKISQGNKPPDPPLDAHASSARTHPSKILPTALGHTALIMQ